MLTASVHHLDACTPIAFHDHGRLTQGEGKGVGRQGKGATLTIQPHIREFCRLGYELLTAQQDGIKPQCTHCDAYAKFAKARQDFFLHLTGHAGLFGALALRRVRIGIGRESAVDGRCLVEANAGGQSR